MNKENFASLFPIGSHLCREPMPSMSEMKHDMEVLRAKGFNLIKLQENWMVDEPLEGKIDLSKYEELICHAAKLDMGVYIGLTCEQAPLWLWEKHPGAHMVGRNGSKIVYKAQNTMPFDGKPGPCYDDEGAMQEQLRFITHLVKTLGRYENIVLWNVWQEIGYWGSSATGTDICYCENTLKHFRRWLKERYGSLENLNNHWKTRFLSWENVEPDRSQVTSNGSPQDIDWAYFMDVIQPAYVIKSRADAIKAADPFNRPVFAHKSAPSFASRADWVFARSMDFVGSSCYPAWTCSHSWDDSNPAHKAEGRADKTETLVNECCDTTMRFDFIRSANPADSQIWSAEFQGGPISSCMHKGRVPSPADIRRWMASAVAAGVTGINFWVTRSEIAAPEQNGFSLLDSECDSTPRFEEAARIGKALNRHAELFAKPTAVQPNVAILVDESNYDVSKSLAVEGHLKYSQRGWYRYLYDLGIPCEFLDADSLDGTFEDRYEVIISHFPLSMSDDTATRLVEFAQRGGRLITEASPGHLNENGFAVRGEINPVLKEALGVKHLSYSLVREPNSEHRFTPLERGWGEYEEDAMLKGVGEFEGLSLRASYYLETIECTQATPILTNNGAVVGAQRNVGKGKITLIGTYSGFGASAHRNEQSHLFIKKLMELSGITPEHDGKLLIRTRKTENKTALIIFNPTETEVSEKISAKGHLIAENIFGDKISVENDSFNLTLDGADTAIIVLTD